MDNFKPGQHSKKVSQGLAWFTAALLFPAGLSAGSAGNPAVVPKWARFEQSFKSSVPYTSPLQDASLTVWFTAPLGETHQVYGFWDGGKTWRVRFSPDQPGRWTFRTSCSDAANVGLNNQTGEFLCSAAVGASRFERHGPVVVARDHRHFEQADGTPFFWLADTVWNGARISEPKSWEVYAEVRSSQNFTVAQWAASPGEDVKKQSALTGFPDRIAVNPEFFKRLDGKLERLSHAGLLSAIVPLSELDSGELSAHLPDDQAALLVRYVVARFGAEPVVWLLAFEGDSQGKAAHRWKKIGREVFAGIRHAPVLLYAGKTSWLLDEFREQAWVDAFCFNTVPDLTDDGLKWTFSVPLVNEWTRSPARPLITCTLCENGIGIKSKARFGADDVRRGAYWGLLWAPPAGVSYCGQGVFNWDTTSEPKKANTPPGADLPLWQRALFMPGAKQMGYLANFLQGIDFWQLQPQAKALAVQPGETSPRRQIVVTATKSKELGLAYVPEERTLELYLEALPPSPVVTWFDPRTGSTNPAVAVVVNNTCQFPTPNPGDWLLVIKTAK